MATQERKQADNEHQVHLQREITSRLLLEYEYCLNLQCFPQVGDKPALPVKRSKSMKSNSKPVSVIPVLSGNVEPSFSLDNYRSA